MAPVIIICLMGCGFKKLATKASTEIFYDSTAAIDSESDVDLARDSSMGFLKMLEGFYLQNPRDPKILVLLTRSYTGYAYGFTENDMLAAKGSNPAAYQKASDRAKLFYTRAHKYGNELLSLNKKFAAAQEGTMDQFQEALKSFGPKDVENLFWAGMAWGNYLNFNKDSMEAVAELPRIEAVMNRVVELNADYFYGGPRLFLGALYGSRPKTLGGDPDKSKQNFDEANAVTQGKYLMAPVTMAQIYAVQIQDAALFQRTLDGVVAADPAALPEQRLSNELAIERAKILLSKKSQFFSTETPSEKTGTHKK